MAYITSKEASKKWGIQVRQVQALCSTNRVAGAIRFNRSWAIPEDAIKPDISKYDKKEKAGMERTIAIPGNTKNDINEEVENEIDVLNDKPSGDTDSLVYHYPIDANKPNDYLSFETNNGNTSISNISNNDQHNNGINLSLYKQILDQFPYWVNISDKDGVMVYANELFMEGTLDETRDSTIGTYNILKDKNVDQWGLSEHLQKAFRGEKIKTQNLKLAYKDVIDKYTKSYAFVSVYHDISSFPLYDDNNRLAFVVTVFVPVRKFAGRTDIIKAKEYIEIHWLEPFNQKIIAKEANLSLSRFLQLFKEDTGFSPHDYYMDIKMSHLKEQLLNPEISVAQAFSEVGIDYNSYYTKLFKKYVGFTPSRFRYKNH